MKAKRGDLAVYETIRTSVGFGNRRGSVKNVWVIAIVYNAQRDGTAKTVIQAYHYDRWLSGKPVPKDLLADAKAPGSDVYIVPKNKIDVPTVIRGLESHASMAHNAYEMDFSSLESVKNFLRRFADE